MWTQVEDESPIRILLPVHPTPLASIPCVKAADDTFNFEKATVLDQWIATASPQEQPFVLYLALKNFLA